MPQLRKRIILKRPLNLLLILMLLTGLLCLRPVWTNLADDGGNGSGDGDEDDYTVLEPYIAAEMEKQLVPGLSLVFFKDDKIVYSKAFGVKNSATGEPVRRDTVFEAASFSKTLTAYAALILVEKGKLALDEPLDRYLKRPYLPDPKYADQITLRMILNHTSGMSNDSDGNDRKVYFTPGGLFSYSGAGFRYLQQVIEDVTGMPFARFMDRTIIRPLGMRSSSFVFKKKLVRRMATGHEAGKPFAPAKMEVNAAYSLLTTPTDMAKFNIEICHPRLLKPETVAQMLTPSVKWQNDIYWGLGIGLLKSPNGDFYWHWGNNYYFCNMMITDKESKTGVIIMTNGNTGMKLAEKLSIKIVNDYILDEGKDLDPLTFDFIS